MAFPFSRYRFHLLLIFAGFLWLALFGWLTQIGNQGIVYADSTNYLESAKELYFHFRLHSYRPSLMAAITGLPYLFGFGDAAVYTFGFYLNVVCWMGSGLVLFGLLKGFVSEKRAFIFALSYFFLFGAAACVFHLLTESLYVFLTLSAFYFLAKYYRTKIFGWLSLSLSVFVLSVLVKPGALLIAIVFSVFFIREIIGNFRSKAIGFYGASVLLVLMHCAAMKSQFGNFTVSYIDAVTYYNYLGSRAESLSSGKPYSQENNPRSGVMHLIPVSAQKAIAADDLKTQMMSNGNNLLKAFFIDVADNAKSGSTALMDCTNVKNRPVFAGGVFFWISKWQNRILSVAGLLLAGYCLFRYKSKPLFALMGFYVLSVIFLFGISCCQGDRFHLVVFPFVLFLMAVSINQKKLA